MKPLPKPEGDTVCMFCHRNDQVFPSLEIIICPRCLSRVHPEFIWGADEQLSLHNDMPNCNICKQRKLRMWKVKGRVCQKCTVTIAENEREYKHGIRRRFKIDL